MRSKLVAKDLHRRSSVVQFSHVSLLRSLKPLLACAGFSLMLACAFSATAAQAAAQVGAIVGSAAVSATGAAGYTIPISLPPGTNGMQPSLALVYNSQSGEGAAGYDWTLSGLSAITRCPWTTEDNGMTQAVQFTASGSGPSDDFCLDGQHLILSGGTGFSNGSSYSTEIQNFSQIKSYTDSSATNGPSWFEIKTKDGHIYDYGNTADSKIYAQGTYSSGTGIVRAWALARVTDTSGNYYAITYQNNYSTSGDYWPLSISYSGNSNTGSTPLHTVTFGWTQRSNNSIQATYLVGSLITQTQLLSGITVSYNGSPTFVYTLSYQTDASNFRNLLSSVKECDGSNDCFPVTSIQWQGGTAGWGVDEDTGVSVSDIAHATSDHLMDVDGDGIMDLVYVDSATSHWMVMFGQPGGGLGPAVNTNISAASPYYQYALAVDYNGDGRMDLLVPTASGWQLLQGTGSQQSGAIFSATTPSFPALTANNSVTNAPIYQGNVSAVDFFGRGLTDLVYSDGTNVYLAENGHSYSSYSTAPVVNTANNTTVSYSVSRNFVGTSMAFDDSGRSGTETLFQLSSVCHVDPPCPPPTITTGYDALQASGSTTNPTLSYMSNTTLAGTTPEPISATGGALTSLLATDAAGNYHIEVSTNSNTGFIDVATGVANTGTNDDVITDYYGDGHQEALVETTGGAWEILRANYVPGTGFSVTPVGFPGLPPYPSGYLTGSLRIGNIDPLGFDDLVYAFKVDSGQYNWHYKLHNTSADLVTSITDGFGNKASFTYGALTSGGALYTENNTAQYPIRDVNLPMLVVSTFGVSDGIGGTYTLNYSYAGAQFDTQGHGFLGFASRTITDNTRGTTEIVKYSQVFPWTGMVYSDVVSRFSDGKPLSDTERGKKDQNGNWESGAGDEIGSTNSPFFETSITTTYNYVGATQQQVSQAMTSLSQSSFDQYGNLLGQQTVVTDAATGDQFTSTTSTSYATANTSSYCVGLPFQEIVTRQTGAGSLTQTTSTPTSDQDTTHCRLNSQTVQGADSNYLKTAYQYDSYGNVSETDVSGSGISATRTTQFDYTGGNDEFPTKITFVSSPNLVLQEGWSYGLGLKTSDEDVNQKSTSYGYDNFGRLTLVTRPDGTKTQYNYNWCSPSTGVACPASGIYQAALIQISNDPTPISIPAGYTAYDMKGRTVEQGSVMLGGVTSLTDTTYDNMGHVVTVMGPYFSGQTQPVPQATYSYDSVFNRVTNVVQPENAACAPSCTNSTTLSYSVAPGIGFEVSAQQQVTAGTQTTAKYSDVMGEVVKMLDANNGTTQYTYDPFGDLSTTTDADGNVTHLIYDGLGHKTQMTDPNMGQWNYLVDALGEMLCQTDTKGQSQVMFYGSLGRVTQRVTATAQQGGCSATATTAGVTVASWQYDQSGALGLPAALSDSNGFQRAYSYNSQEQLTGVATTVPGNPTPYNVSTTYDSFSRVSTVTYPVSVAPTVGNAPTAVAAATPTTLVAGSGTSVTLDGTGSSDPNGLQLQYQWSQTSIALGTAIGLDGMNTSQAKTSFVPTVPGTYTFQLEVIDSSSAISAPASASISVYPAAAVTPTSPSQNYTGNVPLNWASMPGVTSYEVFESTNGTNFTQVQTVGTNTATVSALPEGTYYFALVACAGSLCGVQGPASSSITVTLPPGRPTGLAATPPGTTTSPNSSGNYTLNWTAPAAGPVTSYQVYLAGSNSPVGSATSKTNLPISGMTDGTYTYYVVASNAAGAGSGSATTTVVVLHVPGKPGQATASPNAGSPREPFTLSWSRPTSGGAVSYYIVNGNTAVQYATTSASLKFPSDGIFQYYAQGCNNAGCGADSASATLTVTGPPFGGGGNQIITGSGSGGTTSAPTSGTTAAPVSTTGGAPTASIVLPAVVMPLELPAQQRSLVTAPIAPKNGTLAALAQERLALLASHPRQVAESAMQARATQGLQGREIALVPQAPSGDVAAWNTSELSRMRNNPSAPAFAPPAYIAYSGARVTTATTTPYQFAVTYNYDPASGGLESVSDGNTGFIYWRIAGGGNVAPVDAFGHLLGYIDGNNVGTVNAFDSVTGAVTGISTGIGPSSTALQQLAYTWDGFGNLQQRCDANRGMVEKFGYDSINRLNKSTVYTGGATGQCVAGPNTGATIGVSYDAIGNILNLSNSGNAAVGGTYAYDPNHPHAVSTVTNIPGTNSYDTNGNMVCRFGSWNGTNCVGGTQIVWNADNLATCIDKTGGTCTGGSGTSQFSYGPDMQRYAQTAIDASGNTTSTTYIGSLFEVVSTSSGTEYRHNIMAAGGTVAVHTINQAGVVETDYIHSDHLGSGDVITNDTGNIATDPVTGEQQIMSFDAFGLRRDPTNWAYDLTPTQIGGLKAKTDRGYTNQEQLDNVGLVHMNGRIYDPAMGRMVSADPTVPDPMYTQAFNRYAYVYNNPLSATDPSGFACTAASPYGSCSPDDANGAYQSGNVVICVPLCNPTKLPNLIAPGLGLSEIGVIDINLSQQNANHVAPPTEPKSNVTCDSSCVSAETASAEADFESNTGLTSTGDPCDCQVTDPDEVGGAQNCMDCHMTTGTPDWASAGPAKTGVTPTQQNHGTGASALLAHDSTRNMQHSASTVEGLMRFPDCTGSICNSGVGYPVPGGYITNPGNVVPNDPFLDSSHPELLILPVGIEDLILGGIERAIITKTGAKITGLTVHGIQRAIGDGAARAGVRPSAALDALKNPLSVKVGVDSLGRPFQVFVGKDARVVINPETGKIVSMNPLSGAGAN